MNGLRQVVYVFIKYRLLNNHKDIESKPGIIDIIYKKTHKKIHIHNQTNPIELDLAIQESIYEYKREYLIEA